MYICIYINVYLYICIYDYICIYVSMYICIYMYTCVCLYMCGCGCVCWLMLFYIMLSNNLANVLRAAEARLVRPWKCPPLSGFLFRGTHGESGIWISTDGHLTSEIWEAYVQDTLDQSNFVWNHFFLKINAHNQYQGVFRQCCIAVFHRLFWPGFVPTDSFGTRRNSFGADQPWDKSWKQQCRTNLWDWTRMTCTSWQMMSLCPVTSWEDFVKNKHICF